MHIDVELPEDIAKHLQDEWRDLSRGALEAIASEGYRNGSLTRDQVGRLLGRSFWETEAFLKLVPEAVRTSSFLEASCVENSMPAKRV